jgi:hypothetical protein
MFERNILPPLRGQSEWVRMHLGYICKVTWTAVTQNHRLQRKDENPSQPIDALNKEPRLSRGYAENKIIKAFLK